MKTLKKSEVGKTTEKAILVKGVNGEFWIPKSKFADAEKLQLTQEVYDSYASKEPQKEKFVEVFEILEDYNDNSCKTGLKVASKNEDIGERERFWFIPKSMIKERKENSFIVPEWVYESGVKNIITNDIAYFSGADEKFKSLSERDFDVTSKVEVVELD